MAAIPKPISTRGVRSAKSSTDVNTTFVNTYLRPVRTHAAISFRHLPSVDKEELVAESVANAFVNFKSAERRGAAHRLTPSTVANYAVRGVKDGRRAGGSCDGKTDVMSFKAQRLGGFKVYPLHRLEAFPYDILEVPDQSVWRDRLLHDRRTLPSDQAAFRIDLSTFLAGQTDRSRTLLAMLGS